MNTISVERDWAVIVAGGDEDTLRMINAQMRRIDLFCKLIAPLTIAIIDGVSTEIAVVATGCLTVSSVFVEYFTIARVYHTVPNLSAPKVTNHGDRHRDNGTQFRVLGILPVVLAYTRHPAFLPSFSLALLYLTVLSFGGQMVTYLLALGLSSGTIGVLRGVSALLELSATWIAPKVMKVREALELKNAAIKPGPAANSSCIAYWSCSSRNMVFKLGDCVRCYRMHVFLA